VAAPRGELTPVKSSRGDAWQRDRMHRALGLVALAACGGMGGGDTDARPPDDAVVGDRPASCPPTGLWGRGRHRLFVQGHDGVPRPDGRYPLLHQHPASGGPVLCDDRQFVVDTSGDGVWQPGEEPRPLGPEGIVHGEHFLVGSGAFAEFAIELCEDLGGDVALYIPNFDEAGSRTLHQLIVRGEDGDQLVAQAIDEEAGQSGYNPFVRVLAGTDPVARAGDLLILRSTNLSGVAFSVMVWQPPSEYESWIVVEVP
jgi:hypothetical protein